MIKTLSPPHRPGDAAAEAEARREPAEDAKAYGWQVPDGTTHNWGTMVEAIQDHIGRFAPQLAARALAAACARGTCC